MEQAQGNIVSIATFRATRPAGRPDERVSPRPSDRQPVPSARSIEHRRRMLRFLGMEAEGQAPPATAQEAGTSPR